MAAKYQKNHAAQPADIGPATRAGPSFAPIPVIATRLALVATICSGASGSLA